MAGWVAGWVPSARVQPSANGCTSCLYCSCCPAAGLQPAPDGQACTLLWFVELCCSVVPLLPHSVPPRRRTATCTRWSRTGSDTFLSRGCATGPTRSCRDWPSCTSRDTSTGGRGGFPRWGAQGGVPPGLLPLAGRGTRAPQWAAAVQCVAGSAGQAAAMHGWGRRYRPLQHGSMRCPPTSTHPKPTSMDILCTDLKPENLLVYGGNPASSTCPFHLPT